MAKKIKHISKERIQDSQKRLEEKLKENPRGREFLEDLAMIESIYKEKNKEVEKHDRDRDRD